VNEIDSEERCRFLTVLRKFARAAKGSSSATGYHLRLPPGEAWLESPRGIYSTANHTKYANVHESDFACFLCHKCSCVRPPRFQGKRMKILRLSIPLAVGLDCLRSSAEAG
jgi:hypothetical protein